MNGVSRRNLPYHVVTKEGNDGNRLLNRSWAHTAVAVTPTATLQHILGELARVKERYVLLKCELQCAVYANAMVIQPC